VQERLFYLSLIYVSERLLTMKFASSTAQALPVLGSTVKEYRFKAVILNIP
jgi:hypothetical protein